ncbi:MAG: alpha/beta hydrolase [Actinomycetaceae bacterium]|nr:alpha/beta hydrolase [Actinomycetaceae bacterium]
MQKLQVTAAFGVTALLLTACSGIGGEEEQKFVEMKAPQENLQSFYDQRVAWDDCDANSGVVTFTDGRAAESKFKCARVQVPLDYENPSGASIELQLLKYSKSRNAKPLIYNPGGPGGSAVASLPDMADYVFTDAVLNEYDLIAVDPRGVGLSAPVRCLSDEEIDEARAEPLPQTLDEIRESSRELGEKCLKMSPEMAQHSDSDSAMRDFDIVRAVLGEEKLNYVGFSYGTFLGALYADEFPNNVGRFVLDGAIDPTLTVDEISEGQATGFENVLAFWLADGSKKGQIPLKGTSNEMKAELREWLDGLDENPLPTADPERPLTRSLATSAILSMMYSDDTWQVAWAALSQAMQAGDGSMLLMVADLYADRNDDGTYKTNTFDAFNVINALDYRAEEESHWRMVSDRLQRTAPMLGEEFSYGSVVMEGWPIESRDTRHEVKAAGAPPILVVGTTFDPATPYYWAESLADQLESGHLLKVEGVKHTAYSRTAGECVIGAVDGFLIDGEVPAEGTTCRLGEN